MLLMESRASPHGRTGRDESVSQLPPLQERGAHHRSTREAAAKESPARECREVKWHRVESRRDGTVVAAQTQDARPTYSRAALGLYPQLKRRPTMHFTIK